MRVMTVTHGHPGLTAGGAETAAYGIFSHLKELGNGYQPLFVARADSNMIGHDAEFGAFRGRQDEILVSVPPWDHFSLLSADHDRLKQIITDLTSALRPDVVHVHHCAYWGIDALKLFKQQGAKIILTLHEYMAICHHCGQMLKTNGRLCSKASPAECAQCFPQFTPGYFFMRERIIKTYYFRYVDHFISPSRFLAERYVAWGIAADKISVIENALAPAAIAAAEELCCANEANTALESLEPKRQSALANGRTRIGFFGQINPFKGVDILLKALLLMPRNDRNRLFVGIHGSALDMQEAGFRSAILLDVAKLADCVRMAGPYENDRVFELMNGYDWIIVPSTWWENSPMVIQEALALNKGLLCSRIGGIAEKAAGAAVFFEPGSPADLAQKLSDLPITPSKQRTVTMRKVARQCMEQIVGIYETVSEVA
jgi:glycosyltransferase involved in cell wall biosynthesis